MSIMDEFVKTVRKVLGIEDKPEDPPYIPVSQRVCPLCGEVIGFDSSFISIGDTTYHVACVDKLERLERGKER